MRYDDELERLMREELDMSNWERGFTYNSDNEDIPKGQQMVASAVTPPIPPAPPPPPTSLHDELTHLLNMHNAENGSNTPDFILATYLVSCLALFDHIVNERTKWHGSPGQG
jgi:hypothetical protein